VGARCSCRAEHEHQPTEPEPGPGGRGRRHRVRLSSKGEQGGQRADMPTAPPALGLSPPTARDDDGDLASGAWSRDPDQWVSRASAPPVSRIGRGARGPGTLPEWERSPPSYLVRAICLLLHCTARLSVPCSVARAPDESYCAVAAVQRFFFGFQMEESTNV
jgi:hypothetical protein